MVEMTSATALLTQIPWTPTLISPFKI